MFRLPVCPHCGTVYHYRDVKDAMKRKEINCYHCQKKMTVKKFPYMIVGIILPLILCIVINVILLSRMTMLNLIPLFVITIVFLLIIYFILPFFVKFKNTEMKSEKKSEKKKKA